MWRKNLLILALFALCLRAAGASLEEDDTQASDVPKVSVEHDGITIEAPYFNKSFVITEAKRQFDSKLFAECRLYALKLSKKLLIEKQSSFIFGLKNALPAWNKFSSLRNEYKKFIASDPSPRKSKYYDLAVKELLISLVNSKSEIKIDGKEAYQLLEKALDAIQALLDRSPMGMFLDWNNTTMNGNSIAEHLAPVIQSLRDHGHGVMLTFIRKIASTF